MMETAERDWSAAQYYQIVHVTGYNTQQKRMCLAQVLAWLQKNRVELDGNVLIGAHFEGDSLNCRWIPIDVLKRWMGVA